MDKSESKQRAAYVEYLATDATLTPEDKETALRLYDRDASADSAQELPPLPWGADFEAWLEVCEEADLAEAMHAYARAALAAPNTSTPSTHSADVSKKDAGIDTLTDAQIIAIAGDHGWNDTYGDLYFPHDSMLDFARAVLAAAQGEKK